MKIEENMRSSDALQVVRKLALEHLKLIHEEGGHDVDTCRDALVAIEHVNKMITCLKDSKSLFMCSSCGS